MAIFTKTPNGWNPWTFLRTWQRTKAGTNIYIPHVNFPFDYLPANSFWMQSFTNHSHWPNPWGSVAADPFTTFLRGGGITSTVIGSVGGLALVALEMSVPLSYSWGIGREFSAGPQMGYCIGDKYCEMAYSSTQLLRVGTVAGTIMQQATSNEVFQRARLERMYVDHGEVLEFDPRTNVLTLDFNHKKPLRAGYTGGETITIKSPSSGTSLVDVLEILPNFQFTIQTPTKPILAGDMYFFNKPLCVKDPYMLTGFYFGTENSNPRLKISEEHRSGKDLHVTSKNVFNFFVTFTGAYVLKNTIGNGIIPVRAGASFIDSGNTKWHWIKGDNHDLSSIYKDNPERYGEFTSYVEEEIDQSKGGGTVAYRTIETKERAEGTEADIDAWIESGATFIRLEINVGGSQDFNNWHSPILSKCWLKQEESLFKILAHPFGNVIDVSLFDFTGKVKLETKGGGTIFNQYGWFITEHHMETSQRDFFEGEAKILSSNKLEIQFSGGFTTATLASNTRLFNPKELMDENSFFNRYLSDTASKGGCKKAWHKLDGWSVEFQDGTISPIKDIRFGGHVIPSTNLNALPKEKSPFLVEITTFLDIPLTGSRTARVVFGEPYARIGRAVRAGFLEAKFDEGADERKMVEVVGYMDWLNSPIEVNIPSGTVVGVCGGRWWGLADFNSSVSGNSLPMLFTTLSRPQGLSSFYNHLNQEGNIYYKDKLTGKITLRKGLLDLRESPKRIEISYGLPSGETVAERFPVEFDSVKFERVKSVSMTVPEAEVNQKESHVGLGFYLGATGNYYGNLIAGKGPVDLQANRYKNLLPGSVLTENYKYKSLFTSPVYVYSAKLEKANNKKILHIGVSTKDGPLGINYLTDENKDLPDLKNIKVRYVKENQTLGDVGFFDAHQMNDGEHLLIYGASTPSFKINGKEENFKGNETDWKNKNSIFMLGSSDEGSGWGMPVVKNVRGIEQWPLMVLTGVNYLNSIYLENSNTIVMFFKGTDDKRYPYLGAYLINIFNIPYSYSLCETNPNSNFLWRPPSLSNYNWTSSSDIPSVQSDGSHDATDRIYKILGKEGSGSLILYPDDQWGIITSYFSSDGILRLFYDDDDGVKMLYSTTVGTSWVQSRVVLARNASAGLCLNNTFFYITPFGIEMKEINEGLWNNVYRAKGGVDDDFIEAIQGFLDTTTARLIGSGPIDTQRLTGYVDQAGNYYIFFTDSESNLSSLTSKDTFKWDFTQNF